MDTDNRNKLVEEHLPFIRMIAGRYKKYHDTQDLVQEGVLGLIRATETFDPDRNIKFLTYASWWIKSYIIKYLKQGRRYVSVGDEEMLDVMSEVQESGEQSIINQDLQNKTYDTVLKAGVTGRELDIVLSRYLTDDPCTLQELGEKYGVSRERIRQIEKRMMNKIKKRLVT